MFAQFVLYTYNIRRELSIVSQRLDRNEDYKMRMTDRYLFMQLSAVTSRDLPPNPPLPHTHPLKLSA